MTDNIATLQSSDASDQRQARVGVAYGLAAYLWWGFVVVYFKAVAHVPATEILAHRIVWSVVLLSILMRAYGRWGVALEAVRDRRTMITLLGTTVLIATNWLTFIYAIASDQVLQASLGYYINPLVNVLLGFAFLRERLRPWQIVSVLLATGGVGYMTINYGRVPYLSLTLAGSFGLYGLLRKTARVDAMVGLTIETGVLLIPAVAYLAYLASQFAAPNDAGELVGLRFGHVSWQTDVLLALGGVITAVPLLWFTNAARRIRLATLGFLQYIAPSLQFLLAVVVYGETFTRVHAWTFGCIWTALAIYSVDTVRAGRAAGGPGRGPLPPEPTSHASVVTPSKQ